MNLPGTIPPALRGSSFEAAIAGLRELYEELDFYAWLEAQPPPG